MDNLDILVSNARARLFGMEKALKGNVQYTLKHKHITQEKLINARMDLIELLLAKNYGVFVQA